MQIWAGTLLDWLLALQLLSHLRLLLYLDPLLLIQILLKLLRCKADFLLPCCR